MQSKLWSFATAHILNLLGAINTFYDKPIEQKPSTWVNHAGIEASKIKC